MNPATSPITASVCPLCHGGNACRRALTATYKGSCWCERVEFPEALLKQVPESSVHRACICSGCVGDFKRGRGDRPETVEGDFYIDPDGRFVFTAAYHLRRGYCCGNGCRHCPFDSAGEPALA